MSGLTKDQKYRLKNLEKVKEGQRRWYLENKEKAKEVRRKYYYENKEQFTERDAKRRATKRQNLPTWANKKNIRAIYYGAKLIRDSGLDVQVDHVIPLRGKTVSGLHVEDNLKIVFTKTNKVKGNFSWPDMW